MYIFAFLYHNTSFTEHRTGINALKSPESRCCGDYEKLCEHSRGGEHLHRQRTYYDNCAEHRRTAEKARGKALSSAPVAAQNEQAKQPAARAIPDRPFTALSERSQNTAAADKSAAAAVSAPSPESRESPAVISLSRLRTAFPDLLISPPPCKSSDKAYAGRFFIMHQTFCLRRVQALR